MSAAHELPALVTVDDAAASLALHPDQIRRLVRAGELVGYRLGRAVRVDAGSVRDYAARCRLHVPRLVPPPASSSAPPGTAPRPQATTPGAHARNAWKQAVREKSDGRGRKSTAGVSQGLAPRNNAR